MRVSPRELVLWSFLMASAHGAGLMLVPVLVGCAARASERAGPRRAPRASGHPQPSPASDALLPALAAVGLHSAAMLAVAGVLAVVVYQKLGVEVLRRAWVNLDVIGRRAGDQRGILGLGLTHTRKNAGRGSDSWDPVSFADNESVSAK